MADAVWEHVSNNGDVTTHRLAVDGGWLYRVTAGGAESASAGGMALAFVPRSSGRPAAGDEKTESMPRPDD